MQIKPINWQYIGNNSIWTGSTEGLLGHIQFYITKGKQGDEFVVTTPHRSFEDFTCLGLDEAKQEAQRRLDLFALSLII